MVALFWEGDGKGDDRRCPQIPLGPGGADFETEETPSFSSDAHADLAEGPDPVIVGNLVSTQL